MLSKKLNFIPFYTTKKEQTMQKQISEQVGKVRKLMVVYIKFLIKILQRYVLTMQYKVYLGAKRRKVQFLEQLPKAWGRKLSTEKQIMGTQC